MDRQGRGGGRWSGTDGWIERWNRTPRSGVGGGRGVGPRSSPPDRSKTLENRTKNVELGVETIHRSNLCTGEGEGSGRRVAIRATVLPARVSIASTIRFISVDTTVYALPLIHASRRRRRTASTSFSSPFSMSTVYVYIYERNRRRRDELDAI